MACVELSLTLGQPAAMTVGLEPSAAVGLKMTEQAAVALDAEPQAEMAVSLAPGVALKTTLPTAASLTLGEVCTVNSGTIVALAGSDGPFRTRDGGYFLLNPATNPPEGYVQSLMNTNYDK